MKKPRVATPGLPFGIDCAGHAIDIKSKARNQDAKRGAFAKAEQALAGGSTPQNELEAGLAEIQAAAAGVLEIFVISPGDAGGLMALAMAGDAEATRLMRSLEGALKQIEAAPASEPTLCATCPTALHRGTFFRVILALPYRDNPSPCLAFGVCRRCAGTNAEAHTQATRALQNIWTCSRRFDVTHPSGGAA